MFSIVDRYKLWNCAAFGSCDDDNGGGGNDSGGGSNNNAVAAGGGGAGGAAAGRVRRVCAIPPWRPTGTWCRRW